MTATYLRDGIGSSHNAVAAAENDILPMTHAIKRLRALSANTLTTAEAEHWLIETWNGEWHHTGKYASRTDFYDVWEAVDAIRFDVEYTFKRYGVRDNLTVAVFQRHRAEYLSQVVVRAKAIERRAIMAEQAARQQAAAQREAELTARLMPDIVAAHPHLSGYADTTPFNQIMAKHAALKEELSAFIAKNQGAAMDHDVRAKVNALARIYSTGGLSRTLLPTHRCALCDAASSSPHKQLKVLNEKVPVCDDCKSK